MHKLSSCTFFNVERSNRSNIVIFPGYKSKSLDIPVKLRTSWQFYTFVLLMAFTSLSPITFPAECLSPAALGNSLLLASPTDTWAYYKTTLLSQSFSPFLLLQRHTYLEYTYNTAIRIYTDNMTGLADLQADHERLGKTTAQWVGPLLRLDSLWNWIGPS